MPAKIVVAFVSKKGKEICLDFEHIDYNGATTIKAREAVYRLAAARLFDNNFHEIMAEELPVIIYVQLTSYNWPDDDGEDDNELITEPINNTEWQEQSALQNS